MLHVCTGVCMCSVHACMCKGCQVSSSALSPLPSEGGQDLQPHVLLSQRGWQSAPHHATGSGAARVSLCLVDRQQVLSDAELSLAPMQLFKILKFLNYPSSDPRPGRANDSYKYVLYSRFQQEKGTSNTICSLPVHHQLASRPLR